MFFCSFLCKDLSDNLTEMPIVKNSIDIDNVTQKQFLLIVGSTPDFNLMFKTSCCHCRRCIELLLFISSSYWGNWKFPFFYGEISHIYLKCLVLYKIYMYLFLIEK